jgi:hypothetical protein
MLTRETPPLVFQVGPFAPVDGFVRALDAIRWNAGRDQIRKPGRLPLESALIVIDDLP